MPQSSLKIEKQNLKKNKQTNKTKSFGVRKQEYLEKTTDLQQVTDKRAFVFITAFFDKEKFEDTKSLIRSRVSRKHRYKNGQRKESRKTNNDPQKRRNINNGLEKRQNTNNGPQI